MNVQVTARRFKAHESLKEFAMKEVKRLERFSDNITKADVILSYERAKDSIKTAEIVLHMNGQNLLASESTDDFKKSIELAVVKLERQLDKLKTKVIDKKRVAKK